MLQRQRAIRDGRQRAGDGVDGVSRNVGGISIRHIGEPARGIHRYGGRSCSSGKGRSGDGRQRAGDGVDGVSRNVGGISIRHIGEPARGIHRHGGRSCSAAKGDPGMGVSAPVMALMVYPETLAELAFAT